MRVVVQQANTMCELSWPESKILNDRKAKTNKPKILVLYRKNMDCKIPYGKLLIKDAHPFLGSTQLWKISILIGLKFYIKESPLCY